MDITASVISHGHGNEIREVLASIAQLRGARPRRVVITLNLAEPALRQELTRLDWPFELALIDNPSPDGFGINHNRAFKLDRDRGPSELFAVLNPDIRWRANPFEPMLPLFASAPRVGLVYPVQLRVDGRLQDHERMVPTPARLWARYRPGGNRREIAPGLAPDWVNGAFLLMRRDAFASVGGFDEAYHMYCEDVDLCLRLQLAGWRMARADQAVIEHSARRASQREPRHLFWHIASLWRLWRSRTWQSWRARQAGESGYNDSSDLR